MSKARERRSKRRERDEASKHTSRSSPQIVPEGRFELPKMDIQGGRWLILIPLGVIIFFGVIFLLGQVNPTETGVEPNAIWLDASWSYVQRSDEELAQYALQLRENRIGHIFLYVSSLKNDNTWSGLVNARNRFTEVEPQIQNFMARLRAVNPNVRLYAWIEVTANQPEYRLDNLQVQNTVANFAERMISQNGFNGILLDVKPLFSEDENYPALVRAVRASIGLDTQLLLAVPGDLTPSETALNQPSMIAPNTQWSVEYKQRVALQANQIVINAFNSYRSEPVDYIEWVTYQVDSYVNALSALETSTTVLISVPLYDGSPPAHDTQVESLSAALDGVRRGIEILDEDTRPLVQGVAIFSDRDLTASDWAVYQAKWLNP